MTQKSNKDVELLGDGAKLVALLFQFALEKTTVPSPSRGGLGWGWGENPATTSNTHPHPGLPLEGEGVCWRLF